MGHIYWGCCLNATILIAARDRQGSWLDIPSTMLALADEVTGNPPLRLWVIRTDAPQQIRLRWSSIAVWLDLTRASTRGRECQLLQPWPLPATSPPRALPR
jgi:hypothetical protein